MAQSYVTRFNGGEFFRVFIADGGVQVRDVASGRNCLSLRAARVFVGESLETEMTRYSGGYGPKYLGNSVLVHEEQPHEHLEYYYVNKELVKFRALAPIVEYQSPMGNSGVPYPYAVDELGRVYLLAEKKVLEPSVCAGWCADKDPYRYYYTEMPEAAQLQVLSRVKLSER
jgi:hypothetical protein